MMYYTKPCKLNRERTKLLQDKNYNVTRHDVVF